MENEQNNPLSIVEEANSKTLGFFNQAYVNNQETVQSLKTELFELEIQIETLEKTKALYSNYTVRRQNIFSPLEGPGSHTVNKSKQIAEQLTDLEGARELLKKRIEELEGHTQFFKTQLEMLAQAQKILRTLSGEDGPDSADLENAIEFIEDEDSESKTTHNYNVLMLQDYSNYQQAEALDKQVRQELVSSISKMDVLKWLLHSDVDRARVTLDELRSSQQDILQSLDQILEQFHYNTDSRQPVSSQISQLIKDYQSEHPEYTIDFSCDCTQHNLNLPWFISIRLGQLLREVFENIFQHANASHITSKVFISNRLIDVDIHDDGVGIQEDYLETSKWHSGLHKVHEIIYQLDGNIQIKGDLINGTDVRFSFPIRKTGIL